MYNISDLLLCGKGQTAEFYKINELLGCKVYNQIFPNLELAEQSHILNSEISSLILCEFSGLTPNYYNKCVVKFNNHFRLGIVMDYLGSNKLQNRAGLISHRIKGRLSAPEIVNRIIHKMRTRLDLLGLRHCDLNEFNILWFKNKWMAVDLYGVSKK